MSAPLLQMVEMTKSFPGVVALDRVSLDIRAGEVHALMGENGAGKSTLMKCLFGVYRPDGGKILLDGKEVSFRSSRDALDQGVAMVHQELEQAKTMSVADNMWLGRYPRLIKGLPFVSDRESIRKTKEVLDSLGLAIDPQEKISALSVGQRQMVEIAKAVSYGARVLVFDEPTSSLSDKEAELLFRIIDVLREKMCGIVYISHKMNEILRISDRVTVMRDGKHIATENKEGLTTETIIRLMVGRELKERYPKIDTPPSAPLLEVKNLTAEYTSLKDASLTLRQGEILGISGLEGSGRTELLRAIFGLSELKSGEITLDGKQIWNKTPKEALKNGFAYLTEERRVDGIFSILNITENTTISSLNSYKKLCFISEKKQLSATEEMMRGLRVKAPSAKEKIRSLSGGNQQKVILSRWLLTKPRVLLLDEPTRGIDVGAKYDIYLLIKKLASEGCGIIVVSSEMPELIGITHRIIVMSGGRVAGELPTGEATQEKIIALATKYI